MRKLQLATEEGQEYDGIEELGQILEQQYGIRMYDDVNGEALIQVRQDDGWSEPLPVREMVRLRW